MDTPQNLVELLSRVRKLDIQLTVEDGRLVCSAPKGALTPDLKETLKARKAEILELLRHTSQPTKLPPIERFGPETLSSPSLGQQRLWFMEQMDPGGTAYVIPCALRFIGSLNRAALEDSIREMIRRHEVLRTSLIDVGGSPEAVVRPLGGWKMEIVSLPGLSEPEQARELSRISAERTSRHFDLSQEILVRACLVEFGSENHVFLIEFHHICCDGWSLGVLTEELAQLYAAYSAGEASPLPELPIQYSDFARWHRKYSENDAIRSQISYWKQKLSGSLPTIDLPSDRLRPRVMTSHGSRLRHSLPSELFESVRLFSTSENVTPFITLLAAFKILLSRYTGQSDIIVGSVSAGRSRPELERLAGLFVNNLALRTDLSGDPTVRELLGRVRETALGAFSHEDVAFDHLVEMLPLPRDLSRSPLFQIMFSLQNYPLRPLKLPGLEVTRLDLGIHASRFDLTVDAIEFDGAYNLFWEYNTDLFDAGMIERMQIHYRCLLENLLLNPQARISEIQILTPEESDHLIAEMGNPQDYPQDLCVHEWFEKQAAQTPNLVAVTCGSSQLTYAELSTRSNRLAHRLRELGIGPDLLVGLCLERSVEMAIALLAVLKAGGAYVPIDPQYPKERIALMLEDSGAPVLVTTRHLLSHASGNGLRTICLDRDQEALSRMDAGSVVGGATPNNLAYVIYTSGSTGRPKGVEITHRSLVNFLASMRREPGMSPRDRLLAVTTLSFDIAGLEFFLPLVTGAQLVIAPRAAVADGIVLARLLEESGATIMQATPVTWRLLLESGWKGKPGLKILCGGESLPRDLAGQLLSCGDELWNLYGPTETTVWSTLYRVDSRPGAMPIGKPIANTVVYVLDERRKPVPVGVAGELYIGGEGVARGYTNRPELTAEKFIDDPFRKGTRLYRTGDLARWLPDGNLDWLGRMDHQVKVRGYRIELGEIEAALQQQPGVKQAVVIVREDTPGDQRLTAYVVATGDLVESSWSEALRAKLPEYMIPSAFVRLEEFPLTPNRKVDRKLLPAPEGGTTGSAPYEAPRTETEKDVATIWQELLRNPRVGINDNFFDLGGHSLLVVQLQSRLCQQFHREISLVELFQRPTIASIASLLSEVGLQAVGGN